MLCVAGGGGDLSSQGVGSVKRQGTFPSDHAFEHTLVVADIDGIKMCCVRELRLGCWGRCAQPGRSMRRCGGHVVEGQLTSCAEIG